MRIMGLDLGEKTIGVALSDPLGWTAQSIKVIKRDKNNKEREIKLLEELIQSHQVEKIVVGLPLNLNGTMGEQGRRALAFAARLRQFFKLPVDLWDERLSTVTAEKILLEADTSRKKRKQVIDKIAAAVILQGYLEALKNKEVNFS
ncbi:Holliday junction resolvase [Peptococcaceae bacterium SCADC1_2_3]|nr:Holliday junction resolvase [Peptococcaceae bacterium SCADC1_2_3]KFI35564.1 Holliday junction resolvase [Peptococcaceae bacterium SCADC1_2_3]KFI37336.1 Holliday junction resolvase [Peptococcaceae bacterium SCADC1_2_3]HCJ78478.1 Holliday junction resolvase RuvX [Desulfotomaculum sp.]